MQNQNSTLKFEDLIYIADLLQKELDRLQSGAAIEGNHYHEDWMNELNAAKPHIERFEQFKKLHLADEFRYYQVEPYCLDPEIRSYKPDTDFCYIRGKTYKSKEEAIVAMLDYYSTDREEYALASIVSKIDGDSEKRCEGFIINDDEGIDWLPSEEALQERGYEKE